MNKLVRIFVSQIFNSFFPLLIVAILLHISNKNESAPIFLIINFANTYLLFSDYSSNVRFIKEVMLIGGIKKNPPLEITIAISRYIGIKTTLLMAGFIPWIAISAFTPVLRQHFFSSLAGYSFIVAYNFNFYWVYTTSNKEYFFILSNFFSRLALVAVLLLFLYFKINSGYLMFFAGLFGSIISAFFFYRFCIIFKVRLQLNYETLKQAVSIILSDFRLVASNFALMAPTLSLTFFLGYIRQPEQIAIYAVAEKIFLGIRTLLSVAINSVYPVLCNKDVLESKVIRKILLLFYAVIVIACIGIYFFSPILFQLLKVPDSSFSLFRECLSYFLLVIVVISLNVPFMMWLMISNELKSKRTLFVLTIAATLIIAIFIANLFLENTAVSLVQSLLISESIIVSAFLLLYKYRRTGFTSEAIVPSMQNVP